MPDILGFWDRRADDKDFNPATLEIERGYSRRMSREARRELKRERLKRELLISKLDTNIKFSDKGYQIYGNGEVIYEPEGCRVACVKGKKIIVEYYSFGSDGGDSDIIKQNVYALNFAKALGKTKKQFSEDSPRKTVARNLEEKLKELAKSLKDCQKAYELFRKCQ